MKIFEAIGGDTVRITAVDVTHSDDGPVISGLAGTLTLRNRATNAIVSGPTALQGSGDDWYADVAIPGASGTYRATIVLTYSGAQRTFHADIFVA